MKSFIFCTCYIDNESQNARVLRYRKWIGYYSALLEQLGAEALFLVDDGSGADGLKEATGLSVIHAAGSLPGEMPGKLNAIRFEDHLGRSSIMDYPGWWRSFTYAVELAERYGFEKIIHIESDFYILSDRLKAFIRGLRKGWASLFCATYNWPESAVQVICKDNFPNMRKVLEHVRSNNFIPGKEAEYMLPFTDVQKGFVGDRLGEFDVCRYWTGTLNINTEFDYYGQLSAETRPFSSSELRELLLDFKNMATGDEQADQDLFRQMMRDDRFLLQD
jgi:hypothetical protein